MAQNDYAKKLQQKKEKELNDARLEGFQFACNLVAIGLNELYNFGADRISRLEDWCTEKMNGEISKDPEVAAYGILRRIEQIRGKKRVGMLAKH